MHVMILLCAVHNKETVSAMLQILAPIIFRFLPRSFYLNICLSQTILLTVSLPSFFIFFARGIRVLSFYIIICSEFIWNGYYVIRKNMHYLLKKKNICLWGLLCWSKVLQQKIYFQVLNLLSWVELHDFSEMLLKKFGT